MNMKKFMAAATSCCLAATSLLSTSLFQVQAADETLTFDIRGGASEKGENALSFTAESVAESDLAVPVRIYIPENPGVFSIQLKFQVNDGEVAEDGSFGNYGLYLSDAAISNPYCFDSANEGNSSYCFSASAFNAEPMNLTWIYSTNTTVNPDAAKEAGTTAWNNPDWAYDNSFAECTLVIPKGTAAGTYVFDVRTEEFILSSSIGSENPLKGASICTAASNGEEVPNVEFETIPLTITISDAAATTTEPTTTEPTTTEPTTTEPTTTEPTTTEPTTTEPTTTEPTTTSATEPTTTEPTATEPTTTSATEPTTTEPTTTTSVTAITTTESDPEFTGNAEYKVLEDGKYYWNIADVAGTAGDTVEVPVYVYGDPGTAGVTAYFDFDDTLEYVEYGDGDAYFMSPIVNPNIKPFLITFLTNGGKNAVAADGACVFTLSFKIPENAQPGTVYPIALAEKDADGLPPKFRDTDGKDIAFSVISGSITVLESADTVALNYDRYSFTEVGETLDLALLNANGSVTWKSSDDAVATVDQNGFVVCKSLGNCTITAVCGDQEYTCAISGGLFGDVDQNGAIDADDSNLALRAYLNLMMGDPSGLTDEQFEIARVNNTFDANGNPTITADDANSILQFYLGNVLGADPSWKEITNNPLAPF